MDRRRFVVVLSVGLVAAPGSARAQARKSARIGWVGAWYSPSAAASLFDAFRQGMRELGYVEGQNLTIDARWMERITPDEAARLTAELVRSKVDVLVAQGPAVPGVKAEAGSMPVVFGFSGDPVAAKFVTSLARPGGNLTGMTLLAVELAGKRVELLKEAAPRVSRLAVLVNPLHVGEDEEFRESQIAAQRLGLTLQHFPVRTVAEVNAALEAMARDHIDAVVALSNLLIMRQRNAIAEFAAKQRIPTVSAWEDFAVDGNLMTYGPNLQYAWRRVATYVDKVLKGTKPADLPVEQPTKFQLIINLKTAKVIGLTIPSSLLIRADRIVE
jgi:putative ABC transport system substrate-binding protein